MPNRILVAVLFTAALLGWGAPAVLAVDCEAGVQAAEKTLAELQPQVSKARESNRARIQGFLDDARKLIEQARADCKVAHTEFAKASAAAAVALAQGDLAAAHIFIKLD